VLDSGRIVRTGTPRAVLAAGQASGIDAPSQAVTPVTLLSPESIAVRRQSSGPLELMLQDRSYTDVTVAHAAPLSAPNRYVVFLGEGEIGMLRDPGQLDPSSRTVLADELRRRDLTAVIRQIDGCRQQTDVSYVSAQTDRGAREFVVRNVGENARWLGERHVLFVDIDGNRLDIPDVEALDGRSARLLRRAL